MHKDTPELGPSRTKMSKRTWKVCLTIQLPNKRKFFSALVFGKDWYKNSSHLISGLSLLQFWVSSEEGKLGFRAATYALQEIRREMYYQKHTKTAFAKSTYLNQVVSNIHGNIIHRPNGEDYVCLHNLLSTGGLLIALFNTCSLPSILFSLNQIWTLQMKGPHQ